MRENENFIFTLNYGLKFVNGIMVSKERKPFIKIYEYLSKYLYTIENIEENPKNDKVYSNIIWQCWFQGVENMPKLIRVCTESVKEHNKDKKITLITEQNCREYISLPDYIWDKYKRGIIPYAQFSDIIRLMLLEKYGGVWIDATILLTGKLPKEAFESDFFTYKNTLGLCFEKVKNFKELEIMCNHLNRPIMLPSTWFISSASNNLIISLWLKLLLEYWKHEDRLVDYFIMDYFFVLLLLKNKSCRNEFENIPNYLTTHVEILLSVLSEDFDSDLFEEIKSMSPIHKLTLNYIPSKPNNKRFYDKIIGF